ncbi:phosphonate C-P lyase system protein PhnG [Roseitalea porphyridii]|uniref:phosphonate C-P lyase system protein PhnG n=1 Tax=Roseitalea porphyridii TaxID=1852022 RepID=UPI0013153D06
MLRGATRASWRKAGPRSASIPEFELVRGPETGLIALRGRMGGGGAPFNFGEATATRATVRSATARSDTPSRWGATWARQASRRHRRAGAGRGDGRKDRRGDHGAAA